MRKDHESIYLLLVKISSKSFKQFLSLLRLVKQTGRKTLFYKHVDIENEKKPFSWFTTTRMKQLENSLTFEKPLLRDLFDIN